MKIITTSGALSGRTVVSHAVLQPDTANREELILNLYPEERFQPFLGFGGAVTDSAAYVYSTLSPELRAEVIAACYGSDGLGYTLARSHIDSCDFSLESYCADSAATDAALEHFSLERPGKYIFPMLDDIVKACPDLRLLLSPWSPPEYMKDNAKRTGGGKLRPEFRERWAQYMCRYALEYRKRGYNVFAMSVQNEPNAVQTWESCIYTPEEERDFLRGFLAPELRRQGLVDVVLTIWDHNKERLFDRVDAICSDPGANACVGAAGFHWYGGDHFDALRLVRRKYPDKLLMFTEGCIEYSKGSHGAQTENAERYAREILHGFNAGLNAFFDWNLLLDMSGGPNHKGNYCDAPIMADAEQNLLKYNLSYSYIRHFSRYIRPGAVRIGTTCYDNDLGFCAALDPDGSIAAVALNTSATGKKGFVRLHGELAEAFFPPHSITTLLIGGEEA